MALHWLFARRLAPWLYLAPLLAMVLLFWLTPIGLTVYLSLTNVSYKNLVYFIRGEMERISFTLRNLQNVFLGKDPFIASVAEVTLIYVCSVLAINAFYSLVLSIAIAFFVRSEALSTFLRVTWLLPRITPSVVYGLMWLWLIAPGTGPLYSLLAHVGIHPASWLLDKPYSQLLMIAINGYVGVSFGMIIYTAAIKSIPTDLINAARVDGASDFFIARRIILPLLKWPMLFVVSWQTLSLIASYEYILIVWGGGAPGTESVGTAWAAGVMVFPLYAWFQAFALGNYAYGAAIALPIVLLGIGLILLYFKVFGFQKLMQPARIEV
ncbi:MAG: sugar ABC transporter permease [Crenarchaeota archaeon]|nr:sugar ABC transporter permease [Thermoproteota archaeon]